MLRTLALSSTGRPLYPLKADIPQRRDLMSAQLDRFLRAGTVPIISIPLGSHFVVIEVSIVSVVALFFGIACVFSDVRNRVTKGCVSAWSATGVERYDAFSTESRRRATSRQ